MITNQMQRVELVKAHLPSGAELLSIELPSPHASVLAADLDGDGKPEIAAAYKWNGELYLIVLKHMGSKWVTVAQVRGQGYQVSVLTAAPITSMNRNNLLVGWQIGTIWSQLSVYEWTREELRDVAPDNTFFSFMEVEDMPGPTGPDGKAELALWLHDTGEAYRVEVVRWDNGAFVPATDVYPDYFPKVVRYYEGLSRQHPDYSFYWYYLADAQWKALMPHEAIASVHKALSFANPYPSKEKLLQLEELIKQQLQTPRKFRGPALYPAPLKTTRGTKWGYINNQGKILLQPKYEIASDFQENGLATVQIHGKNGLINSEGYYVVPPIYDTITSFSEGRAVVIDREGFKLMNESGQIVTRKPYSYISPLQNGRALFSLTTADGSSRYGYLDALGKEVIPPQFEEAGDFQKGKAVVKVKDHEYALIGLDGKRVATYPFAFVGALGDGLLPFQKETNGKYGYIDEQGQIRITPVFTGALSFQNGRAVVNTAEDYGSQYGLIDRRGTFVIQPGYNEIRQLGEQRVALGKAIDVKQPFIGSIFAVADNNGRLLTDFHFSDVADFKNGLASVTDSKETYFINTSGLAAAGYPRIHGSGTLILEDSIIQANVDRRLSYLNRAGRILWQQNTIIPLRMPFRVKEGKYKPNKDYLVYYPQLEGMVDKGTEQMVNDKLKQLSEVKPVPGSKQLDYSYTGDFDVAFFQKDLLVLELDSYNFPFGAAHGMSFKKYVHLNVVNGRMYQLKDLFTPGSNYVSVLSNIVGKQIKQDPQYSYVFPDTYKGIQPDQPFFVTENALHLYFTPYEIAPYAAGFPTFTIPFQEIMGLIAVDQSFWKSFH